MDTAVQVIAQWRDENADDTENHNFVFGGDNGCLVCGDADLGLLHAFDPSFPADYHDEAIYEVAVSLNA